MEDETQVAEHPGREQQRRPREFIRKDGQAGSSRLGVAPRGCTHLFVTEQAWMEPVIRGEEVTEGSLSCPNCTGKVGTFSWIGMREGPYPLTRSLLPSLSLTRCHRHKMLMRGMGCSRLCPAQEQNRHPQG